MSGADTNDVFGHGSRELARVEKIITLGDRPEFGLIVEQIATKLKEANRA
jgi:hypothetical protein